MQIRVTSKAGWNQEVSKRIIELCKQHSIPFLDRAAVADSEMLKSEICIMAIDDPAKYGVAKYVYYDHWGMAPISFDRTVTVEDTVPAIGDTVKCALNHPGYADSEIDGTVISIPDNLSVVISNANGQYVIPVDDIMTINGRHVLDTLRNIGGTNLNIETVIKAGTVRQQRGEDEAEMLWAALRLSTTLGTTAHNKLLAAYQSAAREAINNLYGERASTVLVSIARHTMDVLIQISTEKGADEYDTHFRARRELARKVLFADDHMLTEMLGAEVFNKLIGDKQNG